MYIVWSVISLVVLYLLFNSYFIINYFTTATMCTTSGVKYNDDGIKGVWIIINASTIGTMCIGIELLPVVIFLFGSTMEMIGIVIGVEWSTMVINSTTFGWFGIAIRIFGSTIATIGITIVVKGITISTNGITFSAKAWWNGKYTLTL